MNIKYRHNKIFLLTLILTAIGLIMVTSASWPQSMDTTGTPYHFAIRQLISAIIGLIILMLVGHFDYHHYQKYAVWIFAASLLFSVLPFIPGIGKSWNNAARWIDLRIATIMPSDYLKIGAVIITAKYLSLAKTSEIRSFSGGFLPLLILIGIPALLILKQPDLSTTMVLAATIFLMFIAAGLPAIQVIMLAVLGIAGTIFLIVFKKSGYSRISRIVGFLDPLKNKTGAGWQIVQSLYAVSMGGLFGVGLGNSNQKFMYLSQAHNDYIFAIIAEELGFIGSALIILLFTLLIREGFRTAAETSNSFGSYLALGITLLIGIQAFFNIAVALSLVPATGLTLPFISYGGSSLIAYMLMIGILINISRKNSKKEQNR